MTIALVGLPGGGKSTAGRQLARRIGFDLVDSDAVIEKRIGCSIRSFFEREGEDRFRDIEEAVIAELVTQPRIVLATGGGAVLREANRRALHERTTVVYLRSTPDELFRRLRHDTQRPLLQVADPLAKLKELYRVRDPLYRQTAHFVVETGRPSVTSLVNMIVMQLELAGVLPFALQHGLDAERSEAPASSQSDPDDHDSR
ncbi:shikimate kinase [Aquabacterium sp.]|uniref:shikimate kinase n=1 Tax=Aquabacterium sp. TaxID=1872578 RepID=UPI0035B17BC5